jgi:hypothetical protein
MTDFAIHTLILQWKHRENIYCTITYIDIVCHTYKKKQWYNTENTGYHVIKEIPYNYYIENTGHIQLLHYKNPGTSCDKRKTLQL